MQAGDIHPQRWRQQVSLAMWFPLSLSMKNSVRADLVVGTRGSKGHGEKMKGKRQASPSLPPGPWAQSQTVLSPARGLGTSFPSGNAD